MSHLAAPSTTTSGVLSVRDRAHWQQLLQRFPRMDITYQADFCDIFERYGDGKAVLFFHESEDALAILPLIIRPISRLGDGLFRDAITPYCYGGPLVSGATVASRNQAASSLMVLFREYAAEENIVSLFVRFHPYLGNSADFTDWFAPFHHITDHVIIDVTQDEEQLFQQCRSTFRRYIRRARDVGLDFSVQRGDVDLKAFMRLYDTTMFRHNQAGYLAFDDPFFELLKEKTGEDLLLAQVKLGDEVVAASLYLCYGDYMDYYLGASDASRFNVWPNHFMFHSMALWAHREGFRCLHMGGGSESLKFFKRGFSKMSISFETGAMICLPEAFRQLTEERRGLAESMGEMNESFFPPYRSGE